MKHAYGICLADYDSILPEIAAIIGAEYKYGDFNRAVDTFESNGIDRETWCLRGTSGVIEVELEAYEGYYFSSFQASEPGFENGKRILWKRYLAQGGNIECQEAP